LISMKHWVLMMLAVALAACGAAAPGGGGAAGQTPVPAAIAALIHELETQPVVNPPAFVASYDYSGNVVYYVPPRCCDIFGDLYNSAGQIICHPDGGLAGRGDGRCPDFLSQRTNETMIWRDPRTAS
jgi:hypothetical protein